MWPRRLEVNKLLRKRLGSNSTHAEDIPNSIETSLEIQKSANQLTLSHKNYFTDHHTYKLFVSSWNVGGVAPPEELNLDDWLGSQNNNADIYVLGFQEIVPLNAGNVLGSENIKISMKWNSLIQAALNNKTIPSQERVQKSESGEFQKVHPLKEQNFIDCVSPWKFQSILSKQMVGIYITVWVRSDLCQYISNSSVSCVGCGIMGCLGNKGSVSVRFWLHETSFCFVCSHLASGGKEGDERQRNADAIEILSRTSFPRGPLQNLPRKILDHDRVIWLGDLNYRIYLPEATTRSLVEKRQWNILLQNDQLKAELKKGHVFEGWHEELIKFAPTYKYYPNSDDYYGCHQKQKGKKKRTPAWCDRIIWYGEGLKQNQYSRAESRLSDHRPVRAIFTAEVKVLTPSNGSEQQLFFSNRFKHLTDTLDLCINNRLSCNGVSSLKFGNKFN